MKHGSREMCGINPPFSFPLSWRATRISNGRLNSSGCMPEIAASGRGFLLVVARLKCRRAAP
jgi:hypothetical protein